MIQEKVSHMSGKAHEPNDECALIFVVWQN